MTVTTTNLLSMLLKSTVFVVITAILIPAASIGFVVQHQGMPTSPLLSPKPMARSVTTSKGEDAVDSAVNPTDTQLLLWQRQIKLCGNDVTKGVHLLRQILATQNIVSLDDTNCHGYESLYVETLGVIGRAKRSNPKCMIDVLTPMASCVRTDLVGTICYGSHDPIQQLALQLYSQCPTDACRARTISICNTAPSHTKEQQHNIQTIAIQLLKFGDQPPSIPSYHATFAACAIAKDYQYILDMLQNEVPPASTTTLSYNILFTALSRAEQGYLALDILKEMIRQQQQLLPQTQTNGNLHLKKLPPPDLTTFHLTIKALIASKNIDVAYGLLNTMMEFDNWYRQQTSTKETPLRPNSVTFDLLINAYSRIGAWDKVKFVETIQSQYTNGGTSFVFAALPFEHTTNHVLTATTSTATELQVDDQPIEVSTIKALPLSYFSSSIRLQWENVGMKKFKNEKFWMIGTYIDHSKGYNFIVALQPHRNPIKNGIKILLYNHDMNATDAVGTTKVGYLLMINHPVNDAHDNETLGAIRGSSTLLGVYLDPAFRQGGLSKIFIAMWLQLCYKARAVPRTGIMNKPLLALVLQHTFHFVPEVTSGSNGVNVEVSLVANTTATDLPLSVASSSPSPAAIGIYSSNIKCLQGVFSLRDIRRENMQLLREPSSPHRGRSCQIGATFVLSNLTTTTTVITEVIEQQLLGKSKSGKLVYNTNDLNWENVFFAHNEPQ